MAVREMDEWLTNLDREPGHRDTADRLRRAKPADLTSGCWDGQGDFIVDPVDVEGGDWSQPGVGQVPIAGVWRRY
jgi:hypothetical protein